MINKKDSQVTHWDWDYMTQEQLTELSRRSSADLEQRASTPRVEGSNPSGEAKHENTAS